MGMCCLYKKRTDNNVKKIIPIVGKPKVSIPTITSTTGHSHSHSHSQSQSQSAIMSQDNDYIPVWSWYFKHGTIVHNANNLTECYRKMVDTTKLHNDDAFFAYHVTDGLFSVQFSTQTFPDIEILVAADSGFEAGSSARKILAMDYMERSLIYIS